MSGSHDDFEGDLAGGAGTCHVLPFFELGRGHEAVFSEPFKGFKDALCSFLDGMGLFLSAHCL